MPSKIKKRGKDSYLLTVVHEQKEYTKTIQAESKPEAEQQWTLFAAEVLKGKVLSGDSDKMTLAQFYEYWKKHYAEDHLEITTRTLLEGVYDRIGAALGHIRIDKITPKQILNFYEQLRAPDASVDDTPLSQAYIRKHASLLKTLLNTAYQWDFITKNPCDKVKLPKAGRSSKRIPSEEELKQFFAALSTHKILKHRLWVMLSFSLGMRREEIFGLKWKEVNFDKHTLTIALAAVYVPKHGVVIKDTKTDNSYRTISLPPDIVAMLADWKEEVKAAAKRRAKRNKVVVLDDPVGPDKWLFTKWDGSVAHPHSFNSFLSSFCEEHNLPLISPHTFRHLSGSYLLKSGLDIATISAKLGHSDKSFTLKTYIHELQSAEEHSAEVMQGILDRLKPSDSKGQAK
ncbi:MAG: site-specific integrase [Veillonellales bacterium]